MNRRTCSVWFTVQQALDGILLTLRRLRLHAGAGALQPVVGEFQKRRRKRRGQPVNP